MKNKLVLIGLLISAIILSAGTIDVNNLFNYSNQSTPNYITKDNTNTNTINDQEATLGRVLFYDKNLSVDNSTACASCHIQQVAFGDTAQRSVGLNGLTGRHSMRLINTRFADEVHFFWDERANTLEDQVIEPIQDHTEMGLVAKMGTQILILAKEKLPAYCITSNFFNLYIMIPILLPSAYNMPLHNLYEAYNLLMLNTTWVEHKYLMIRPPSLTSVLLKIQVNNYF